MTILQLALILVTVVLCVIILLSALYNVRQLSRFRIPNNCEIYSLKRVFVIRNILSILVSIVYLWIIVLHIINGESDFNNWYLLFHYLLFVILYVDTCAIRVYVSIEKNKLHKIRRYDRDYSIVNNRRIA